MTKKFYYRFKCDPSPPLLDQHRLRKWREGLQADMAVRPNERLLSGHGTYRGLYGGQ